MVHSFGTIPDRNRITGTRNRRYSCSFGSYSVFGMNGISFFHSAPDMYSRKNRMNGIRFTWNMQNMCSFGKFLAGNPTWLPVLVAWLLVGRRSSFEVTSAMSIQFSEWMSIFFKIEIQRILLFLNQNSTKRTHPKLSCQEQAVTGGAGSRMSYYHTQSGNFRTAFDSDKSHFNILFRAGSRNRGIIW